MLENIRYIKRRDIDTQRWDACIEASENSLVYAFSFYLDSMAVNWDALVLDDYKAVFPLTWNKKWGIRYLYQPPFTQQLGLFFTDHVFKDQLPFFLTELQKYFRFAEILINYDNGINGLLQRSNFTLPLQRDYATIASGYKNDLIRNLKRAEKFDLRYHTEDNIALAIGRFKSLYGQRMTSIGNRDYHNFELLCEEFKKKRQLVIRTVSDSNNQWFASALLIASYNRLYLLQSATNGEGRNVEANHYLIDRLIREFSNTAFTLDFEGSQIPGIAHFYQNFGSINQPFFMFRFNHLPWPMRVWKS